MKKHELDAMLEAQRNYEKARFIALYGTGEERPKTYQFVDRKQISEIARATGMDIKLTGEGTIATYQLEYDGCLFQAPAGRAD